MGIARTIAKNTIFTLITSLSELGIAFVTGIMLTRGLGTEQYGVYAYTTWLIGLTAIATNLGLGEMSRRFIPEAIGRQSNREVAGFIQLSLLFRITAAIIVCLVIFLSSSYWAHQSGDINNRIIFFVVALTIIPSTIQASLTGIFQGFQRFDYSLYVSLAINPIRLVLIIIFMNLGYGVLDILILNIGTLSLGILIGIVLLSRLLPLKSLLLRSLLSNNLKKQAFKYSFTVAGMLILGYLVSQQAEVYFIGLYCSINDVGFYSLAFRIGTIMGILPTAFAFVLLPVVAEQFGSGEIDKLKKTYVISSRFLMLVALPLSVFGIALSDSLVSIIYGIEYKPVIPIFQIICLPIAVSGLTGAGDAVIRGVNRPSFLLLTQAISAVLNIGLSILLIPKYGIIGAAIASSIPLIIYFPVYSIFISKKVGANWPVRDMIKIIIASSIMGLVIYIIHKYLVDILSLIICIPLGLVLYVSVLFMLKEIYEEDLEIVKKIQNYIPSYLKKYFVLLLGLLDRIIVKKS